MSVAEVAFVLFVIASQLCMFFYLLKNFNCNSCPPQRDCCTPRRCYRNCCCGEEEPGCSSCSRGEFYTPEIRRSSTIPKFRYNKKRSKPYNSRYLGYNRVTEGDQLDQTIENIRSYIFSISNT